MSNRLPISPCRLAALVLCSVSIVACYRSAESRRQDYLQRGDEYLTAKDSASAIIEYRNAVLADPGSAAAHFKLAEAYAGASDVRNALAEYVRAADLDPGHVDAQLKASQLLILARQYNDAKTRLRGVLAKDPDNATALLMLGNALAGLRSFDEAVAANERAAALDPTRSGLFLNLGTLQFASGSREEALEAFQRAVDTQPNSPDTHIGLATYYWVTRKLPEAERSLKRAIEVGPDNVTAHRMMASFYYTFGRPDLAEQYLKRVVDIKHDVRSRVTLSDYYVAVGRVPEAVAILEAVSKEKGAFSPAKIRIAMIRYVGGHREEASRIVEEVLKKHPKDALALATKAHILLGAGQAGAALEVANAAVTADISSPRAHFAVGKVLQSFGRVDEARKAFLEVVKLEPAASEAQIELSKMHLDRNEIDSATAAAQQAIQGNPRSVEARLALARAMMARPEDRQRAEAELRAVVKEFPRAPEVQHALGELAMARGDSTAARRSFEAAWELDRSSWQSLERLVVMHIKANRPLEARRLAESALAEAPHSAAAMLLTGKAAAAAGDVQAAERHLRRVIELEPNNIDGYTTLAGLYLVHRQLDKARDEFVQIAKLQPRSVAPATMVGIISEARGDRDAAVEWYRKALQIDGGAAAAANNLAWLYAESGEDLDTANELAQIAYAKLRDVPEVADTMAWVHHKRGLTAQAIPILLRCIDKDPTNPLYHFHLGMAYAKQQADTKARASLEKALALKPDFPGAAEAKKTLRSLLY